MSLSMSQDNPFSVEWSKAALRTLFSFNKIGHDSVYRLSQNLLSKEQFAQADKIADYENYRYKGYCLKMIRNVVIVYTVNVSTKKVLIRACHHGGTGEVAQTLYGIRPPFNNY
jgi:mRNA-degrading endonuclease RelE of RelBE toxin-antitoxin system